MLMMMMLPAMIMMMTMQGVLYLRTEIFSEMRRYKNIHKGLFQFVLSPDDDDHDFYSNDAQRPFQRERYDFVLTMDRF